MYRFECFGILLRVRTRAGVRKDGKEGPDAPVCHPKALRLSLAPFVRAAVVGEQVEGEELTSRRGVCGLSVSLVCSRVQQAWLDPVSASWSATLPQWWVRGHLASLGALR